MRCGWKQVWASVENRMAGRRETVPSPVCSLAAGAGEWQRRRVDGDHFWVVQRSRQEGKVLNLSVPTGLIDFIELLV